MNEHQTDGVNSVFIILQESIIYYNYLFPSTDNSTIGIQITVFAILILMLMVYLL